MVTRQLQIAKDVVDFKLFGFSATKAQFLWSSPLQQIRWSPQCHLTQHRLVFHKFCLMSLVSMFSPGSLVGLYMGPCDDDNLHCSITSWVTWGSSLDQRYYATTRDNVVDCICPLQVIITCFFRVLPTRNLSILLFTVSFLTTNAITNNCFLAQ